MTDKLNDFGLIGLAVMGQNLVLNIESRGFSVSVYNRSPAKAQGLIDKGAIGCATPAEGACMWALNWFTSSAWATR